ncbi:hypothetical protein RSAG8_08565, partial [Rhizoctonia solani AG-8 WAC10335]
MSGPLAAFLSSLFMLIQVVESLYNLVLWLAQAKSTPGSVTKEDFSSPTRGREGRDANRLLDGHTRMFAAAADSMTNALRLLPKDEDQVDIDGINKGEARISIIFSDSNWKGVLEKGNHTIALKGSSLGK